ncbi:MAG: amidohydrolase [Synergistaceae bacterium]|jgi:amidohydrolase|nr:amidohydrolase [Synergistaceae bacterium]
MINAIMKDAKKLAPKLAEWRRWFHRKPELSFAETETTKEICRILSGLGFDGMKVGVSDVATGVVVDLRGASPGRVIALRADIDALPITEENDIEYRSQNDGVMHACGHDAHIAMLLGAAAILIGQKNEFAGTVRLIFQPSEEAYDGGAKPMIAEGVLDGVDAIAGIHVWQPVESGVFAYTAGAAMASCDRFKITVRGCGGHGAYPHQTTDPIVAACSVVCQLQTIASREIDPLETGVITVGLITSGTANNIIPDIAVMEGTIRSLSPEVRSHIFEGVARVAECVAKAHRCSASLEIFNGYPPTVNDIPFVKRAVAIAKEIVGPSKVIEVTPTMGAEDMGFYLEKIPGCYLFLGIGNEDAGLVHPHHSSKFNVDESVLETGSTYLAYLARSYLEDSASFNFI